MPLAGELMFDELQMLRDSDGLRRLLAHYATLGDTNREIWQDRVMQMEGLDAKELTGLHGQLMAFAWIELNTGMTPTSRPGVVAGWYRITGPGQRALKRAQMASDAEEGGPVAA
jgi:hypothetical protein